MPVLVDAIDEIKDSPEEGQGYYGEDDESDVMVLNGDHQLLKLV